MTTYHAATEPRGNLILARVQELDMDVIASEDLIHEQVIQGIQWATGDNDPGVIWL